MIVTHTIRIDLQRPGIESRIYAVQDDKYCRNLKILLFEAGVPWVIPKGTSVLVRYRKPDGTEGVYDTLPDGNIASSITENALTIALAPQVLTVAGPVSLTATMIKGNQQLTTFSTLVQVTPNASANLEDSEDYFNVTGFLPAPTSAVEGQYLVVEEVDADGKITKVKTGASGVYTLAEGETLEDVPADADVVIDPYGEPEEEPEENTGTDISLGVSGASVGQVVKISAVDENGVPTAWEPVEMPDGGDSVFPLPLLYSHTTTEEVRWIDTGDAFTAKSMLIIELDSVATTTNENSYGIAASARPVASGVLVPYSNYALIKESNEILNKQYDMVLRAVAFRGEPGYWNTFHSKRTLVNGSDAASQMQMSRFDHDISGVIIGDRSAASGTRVFGIGTTLKIWGV